MITRGDAIANTHPNVITIRGDKGYDSSDNEVSLDESSISTEEARLQVEYDTKEYARNRKPEYPDIGDQLDALLKHLNYRRTQGDELVQDLDDIIASWLSVKSKYPKP